MTLLRLGNLLPAVLDRFLLAQTGRLPDTLNELLLIVADIPAYPLDCREDRHLQLLCGNIVNGAILHRSPVSGTGESIVNVLALDKAVVVGQLCAAVGAVEQSGQAVGAAAPLGCPAHGFPQTLDIVPRFLVNDGGDGSLEHKLFLWRCPAGAFGLVVLADGFAQHFVPQILRPFEDITQGGGRPGVGVMVAAGADRTADALPVFGGDGDLLGPQRPGDAVDALAVHDHLEDAAHNSGGFLVNHPLALVLLGGEVAIGNGPRTAQTFLHPGLENALDFAAGVGHIPFVYHVPENRHDVKAVGGVQVIIGGDEADVVLVKGALEQADLHHVTAYSALVFDNDSSYIPGPYLVHHSVQAGPLEGRSPHSVIGEVADISEAIFSGIVLQDAFLIFNGHALVRPPIVVR